MSSFISARFEKDALPTTAQVRVVVRNVDQGNVPPQPSTSYFPTDPDSLRPFIVADFISRVTGESFARVANLTDLNTLTTLTLNTLEDVTTDFLVAGVVAGDNVQIMTLPFTEIWTSEEYTEANLFTFTVSTVVSATQLEVSLPFPAFNNTLTWAIPTRSLTGTLGVTIRAGNPADATTFLDKRFNRYFTDAVAATQFVTATKANLIALAVESTGAGLVSENFTAETP